MFRELRHLVSGLLKRAPEMSNVQSSILHGDRIFKVFVIVIEFLLVLKSAHVGSNCPSAVAKS